MIFIKSIFRDISVRLKSIFNREHSDNFKIGKQTNVNQLNVYKGLTTVEAVDLINKVVDQKLIGFKSEAELTFGKRVDEFKQVLIPKLGQLSEQELDKLRDPDTILALKEASEISGRKTNHELRQLLANLVIRRIKNNEPGEEELKNLVYNEAISTIAKLTPDQLKIITLCYLLRYTSNSAVTSIMSLNVYLNTSIKPFLEFRNTISQFQHIEYAGCGSINTFGISLSGVIKNNYFALFQKPIEPDNVQAWGIETDLLTKITSQREDKLYFVGRNKVDFKNNIKQHTFDEQIIKSILGRYEEHALSEQEVKDIVSNTDIGRQLINVWEESELMKMTLTTVGIVIGATNYEQILGDQVNIDKWIN
jgi:hypothetical protein